MPRMIRFASLLSPVLYETYAYIADYVGRHLDLPTTLSSEYSLEEIAEDRVELSFQCGLLYVHLANRPFCPVEPLVAPVLQGTRYQDRPIYFSDVVVRHDSAYTTFDDLQGCSWAYNERASHSGYNLVYYSLLQRGKDPDYFGSGIASGSHLQSLHLVLQGQAMATAIDSHLLDVLRRQQPELTGQLRIIDQLGPSTAPPLVISRSVDPSFKQRIQAVLLGMHHDSQAARRLRESCIERLALVHDEDYRDIRVMFSAVEKAQFSL